MPQLDKYLFMSQFFWLFCLFWLIFFYIKKYILPKILIILKSRIFLVKNLIKNLIFYQKQDYYLCELYDNLFIQLLKNFNNFFNNTIKILKKNLHNSIEKDVNNNIALFFWKYNKNLYKYFIYIQNIRTK